MAGNEQARGCLTLIAVCVGISALFWIWSAVSGSGGGLSKKESAVAACQKAVTNRLNAPSTAIFDDDPYASRSGKRWTVLSAVEAENALGGRARRSFSCKVVDLDGTWDVTVDLGSG